MPSIMGTHAMLALLISCYILHGCYAPPVTQKKEQPHNETDGGVSGLEDYMEYHRYLKEVVNALESDPDFRQKLEKANEDDIRSGKIAEELEFVSHHVRNRLDELKRVELNRLKELTERKRQLMNNVNHDDPAHHGHLDRVNPHTFEIEDLKKLIAKTTEDLAEADRKRRAEFKQYEMEKEYEKQVKLNHTNGTEREKLEQEFKEREEKHKKHEKLHEPGHKAQLEEVWEEQDQMQQEFDPKTFFMLHDLDSNGLWDQDEVKALFVKELEKMYKAGEPEDDMRERTEEMERMRESVFKEVDLNRDGFIDYDEFLAQTKRNDFQQDNGWQSLDETKPYTNEELEDYIRRNQLEETYGYPPYPPGGPKQSYPGFQQQVPLAYADRPLSPQQQFHPGQVPQHPPHQLQGHLPDLNTNEIYPRGQQNQHPNQIPPGGYQQPQGGYQQPQGGYQQPQGGYQQPQGGYQQPQGGYQQPQGNYQQPQGSYQQGVRQSQQGQNQQPSAQHQQPPEQHQQPAAQHQQPAAPHQQPSAQHQQPPAQHQQNIPQQQPQSNFQQPNQAPPVNSQQKQNDAPPAPQQSGNAAQPHTSNQGSPQVNQV